MTPILHLDWETKSEVDLKTRGLDVYSADPSTEVLMAAWSWGNGPVEQWDREEGPLPAEIADALTDPHVEKWAFNAQFERIIAKRVLGLKTGYANWRCTKVLGLMQGFFGTLDDMGRQIGLPADKQKMAEGKRLMRIFSMPQKTSAKKPLRWRSAWTDPEEWEEYKAYNRQDVVTEREMKKRLIKYPILPFEWDLYEIDQVINDRGIPVDMDFVEHAIEMAAIRKAELTDQMREITGLVNPNSTDQLKEWVKARGYPFDDLKKETIKKVLTENFERAGSELTIHDEDFVDTDKLDGGFLEPDAARALMLRQQAARTSVSKYNAVRRLVGPRSTLRYGFQFHGASRTGRDAGRGLNPQNLTRTPPELEVGKEATSADVPEDFLLESVTESIRTGDYEGLALTVKEPMNALAGTVRSLVRAPEGFDLIAADLASIETCVIAWVSGCERLLNVFRSGLDAYKDFGTELYVKAYEDITKTERTNSKPAVLGCGFRLGGGDLREGKKTGLWGYAENMGINLSRDDSHKAVRVFRTAYPEIPQLWFALEKAIEFAVRHKRRAAPVIKLNGRTFRVPVTFEMMGDYLTIELPSGRRLFYFKPRIEKKKFIGRPTKEYPDGEPYFKENLTYMGKAQNGNTWIRVWSHGGKVTENIVQAIARDILMIGMHRAHLAGFPIILRVHDELVAAIRRGDNRLTVEYLKQLMTDTISWCPDIPLGAAGWQASFYRKD